ncbi:MAG TPA: hypothetical protein VFE23_05735 [Usitatibacter sp.]|jgi:hypothetical protein|nr:hypothetical protein [Usitatibacter sp.]
MNLRLVHASLFAFATSAGLAAAADTPPRMRTPAEESVQQGSDAAPLGSSGGTTGGTTIGSGAGTPSTPGLAVDSGTVMRPLAAEGRNSVTPKKEKHRRQLYGLNPKTDDAKSPDSR